jgi:hypothetical protein
LSFWLHPNLTGFLVDFWKLIQQNSMLHPMPTQHHVDADCCPAVCDCAVRTGQLHRTGNC